MSRPDLNPLDVAALPAVRPLPAWARAKGSPDDGLNAFFLAGAALASLDAIVRTDPPWSGTWRRRLALRCAAATRTGRSADESALRDAWHGAAGRVAAGRGTTADPGPAGRAYGAWRDLAGRSTSLSPERLVRAARDLGCAAVREEVAHLDLPADPLAAAAAAAAAVGEHGSGELGFWVADLVLAQRLRWPIPVPLLAGAIGAASRTASGARIRPGEPSWLKIVALAYAQAAARAVDLAGDLCRRAAALEAAAPKLRATGAGAVVTALLDDDAVPASRAFPGLSDRGARRLFDRLVALGAVRELTGRKTFRLYGL